MCTQTCAYRLVACVSFGLDLCLARTLCFCHAGRHAARILGGRRRPKPGGQSRRAQVHRLHSLLQKSFLPDDRRAHRRTLFNSHTAQDHHPDPKPLTRCNTKKGTGQGDGHRDPQPLTRCNTKKGTGQGDGHHDPQPLTRCNTKFLPLEVKCKPHLQIQLVARLLPLNTATAGSHLSAELGHVVLARPETQNPKEIKPYNRAIRPYIYQNRYGKSRTSLDCSRSSPFQQDVRRG